MDRFPSLLLSLILHLAVFALVLFWPEPTLEKPKLSGLVVRGYVTLGKENVPLKEQTTEPFVGPPLLDPETGQEDDVLAASEQNTPEPEQTILPPLDDQPIQPDAPFVGPVPQEEHQTTPETKEPTEAQVPVEPVPADLAPVEKPNTEELPTPLPKVEEAPQKPEQDTSAIDVSHKGAKKEIPEPKPAKNNATTQKNSPAANATLPKPPSDTAEIAKKPVATNSTKEIASKKDQVPLQAPKAAKATTPKKDALKDVLKDIEKSTPKAERVKAKPKNQLSDVLNSLKEENKKATTSHSTAGVGGTGIGAVTQAYAEVVGEAIKKNWVMASRADQQELFATMRIYLAQDGTIEKYELIKPAGDRLFDSSLVNAIAATHKIPEPPPTQKERVIDVNFYP